MRIVLQRVSEAAVTVGGKEISRIKNGFLALVGLHVDDGEEGFDKIINKIISLRVFPDEAGKMNTSLVDNAYEILLVSQFTLYADCRKGNRPSFIDAMRPEQANKIYAIFVQRFKEFYVAERVKDGLFGADMKISLINDGPVTILL
jgi:D-tyrosyl-tRNA(Tyr) deacylase